MMRLVVPILILLLLLAGAVWALGGFKLPPIALAPTEQEAPQDADRDTPSAADKARQSAKRDAPTKTDNTGMPATPAQPGADDGGDASFDIARIDPNGVSVFAGRADPGTHVTVMGDGQAIGTAEADINGEWTLATEHQFADSDPKLALVTKSAEQAEAEAKAEAEKESARVASLAEERARTQAQGQAPDGSAAREVTRQLLKNLEGMVEEARSEQETEEVATAEPSQLGEDTAPDRDDVSVAGATTMNAALSAPMDPVPRKSVPLPIMFVFNEATMTDEGRKAAQLLLEYLQIKRFSSVTLTGHADERGTNALNMNLSRERLEEVAQFLKDGGYDGQLNLVAKGESEPFTGVSRDEYSRDDLYQLDRRVELVIRP